MNGLGAATRGIVGVALLWVAGARLLRSPPGELARDVAPFATWPPLLALLALAGALAALNAGWSGVTWLRARRAPARETTQLTSPRTETTGAAESPLRAWARKVGPDALLVAALALGGGLVVGAWVDYANPSGVLLGRDTPTYLQNAVAAVLGEWRLYNPDKHVLQSRLAAWLVAGLGLEPLGALQLVSRVSIALLAPFGYLLARCVAGRGDALVLGVLCAAHPWHLAYAPQSTAYPLYVATTVAALAGLTAALCRPSLGRALLAGGLVGLCLSGMEKAALVLAPALAVGLLLAWVGATSRWKGALLAAVGAAALAGALAATAPPVPYTPFSAKVVVQREDLYRNLGFRWPTVKRPDPAAPTRPLLPAVFRETELEALVHVFTAPADSDVLSLGERAGRGGYHVRPNTSIPPLSTRLQTNLVGLQGSMPALPRTSLLLLALGVAGLLVPGPGRGARRWLALAPAAALASAWGPLSMIYSPRYVLHLVPIGLFVAVVGVGRLLALLVGPGRAVRGAVGVAAAGFWLVFAHALLAGDDTAWRRPASGRELAGVRRADDPAGNARATLEVARWLGDHAHPGPIVDCAPNPVWLLAHGDSRFSRDRWPACAAALARPTAGTWLVASSHDEFRGPNMPRPEALLATGGWRVVGGWDPGLGRPILDGARTFTRASVVVLEAVAPAAARPAPADGDAG